MTTPTTTTETAAPSTSSAPTTPPTQRFKWTISPTAPKTPTATADIAAAQPIYEGYLSTYDDSFRSPSAKDWLPVMANYASGQALETWRKGWQGNLQYGLSQKGTMSATARVDGAGRTPAGIDVVSVRACMDFSYTDTVDEAGNSVPMGSGLPTKNFAWLLTFERVNGLMRVVNLVAKTTTGKTFQC